MTNIVTFEAQATKAQAYRYGAIMEWAEDNIDGVEDGAMVQNKKWTKPKFEVHENRVADQERTFEMVLRQRARNGKLTAIACFQVGLYGGIQSAERIG